MILNGKHSDHFSQHTHTDILLQKYSIHTQAGTFQNIHKSLTVNIQQSSSIHKHSFTVYVPTVIQINALTECAPMLRQKVCSAA